MKTSGPTLRLWFEPVPWEDIVAEASDQLAAETGGIVLGWRNGLDVVVTHVVGPGPDARHERASFHPDSDWQEAQIADLYEQSGRVLEYLGDWHTHPGGRPWPSRRDERTLRHIAGAAEARCPDPVMVILGSPDPGKPCSWEAGVFVLRQGSRWRRRGPRVTPGQLLLAPGAPDHAEA